MKSAPIYRRFGRALRKARLRKKMSQQQVSQLVELSRASITQIEGGTQTILFHDAVKLSKALGIDLRKI